MNMRTTLAVALAAGTCLTAGRAALAQQLINISGASLLENYVKAPASTNDFIDVDGNGVAGSLGSPTVQQLAGPSSGTGIWNIQYRVVGSVNGFKELTQFGYPAFVTGNDQDPLGILGAPAALPVFGGLASAAYNNRVQYIIGGLSTGPYNAANPGGAPDRAATSGANRAIATAPLGGITIDIAPLDVSTKWATQKPGTPLPGRAPLQAGYGLNPRLSVGKNGETAPNVANPSIAGGLSSFLAPLNGRNLFDPANPSAADVNTIFDTELNFAPIAPVVNIGTGIEQVTMTELQHLFTTGRAVTGENFVVATRDVGSGTRNAFMNCIGVDPSYGVGDNIGGESASAGQGNIGAQFTPTNKTANGEMERAIRNARNGIGYVGTERGVTGTGTGSWLVAPSALEIASVRNDIYGGTSFVRPTTTNIVHNNANGWVIGGQAVLATIGDPAAEPIAAGGDNTGRPTMANKSAAAYVNNTRKSIAAFTAVPGGSNSLFMPGEFAATQFLLLNSLDNLHDLTTPTMLVPNPGFVGSLQTYTLANNVHNNAAFTSFNSASTGRNPTRTTGVTYNDGVVNGGNYISQGGANVTYGGVTDIRNKVFFDFNGDGARTLADATDLVAAWRQRNGGPVWTAPNGVGVGTNACIEILGDANCDGHFNAADVRFWADGNALNAMGKLDRKAGFTAVDNAFGGNFFGTVKTNSNPYTSGDSRADIAGLRNTDSNGVLADVVGPNRIARLDSFRAARGWAPIGFSNTIDGVDIDYVYANIRAVGIAVPWTSAQSADWSDLSEAVNFDLSADINGDLKVDKADIAEILSILGTQMGDVNLDGVVNSADSAIITANTGLTNSAGFTVGWSTGDLNGDGIIDAADLAVTCRADFNGDGVRNVSDIFAFLTAWFASNPSANFNGVDGVTVADIFAFLSSWFGGC